METLSQTVACHDCDLLQRIPPVPAGGAARCPRCRAVLARSIDRSFERTAALGIAAIGGNDTATASLAVGSALIFQIGGAILFGDLFLPPPETVRQKSDRGLIRPPDDVDF